MQSQPTPFDALHAAVEKLGGQSATARLCEVTQGAVWRWLNVNHQLPAEYVLRVEAATGIPKEWLRPDIYPLDLQRAAPPTWNALDTGEGRINDAATRETYDSPGCKPADNNASSLPPATGDPTQTNRPSGR